jgi:hypothetical protein
MTSFCQPMPQSVVQDMLQIVARAICDRPGDTAAQREGRTRQMVYSVLGFEPRDGLEYMLATTIVGHFHLILDSMRGVFEGQADSVKAKTKSGIVSLDRMMLGFIRELRLVRHRPLARWAEDAQREAEAAGPTETPEWVAPWAGVRPAEPTPTEPASPEIVPDQAQTETRNTTTPAKHEPVAHHASASPPEDADDVATRRHIAEFEEALAALSGSLEQARALDGGKTGVTAASGD